MYLTKHRKKNEQIHILIVSSFVDSAFYIFANIDDSETPLYLMTGSSKIAERLTKLDNFEKNGGVMIVTAALTEGINYRNLAEIINYDAPTNMNTFEQRWGRLHRFMPRSNIKPTKFTTFKDLSNSFPWENIITNEFIHSKKD